MENQKKFLESTLELMCINLQVPKEIIIAPYNSRKQTPLEFMRKNITDQLKNNRLIFEKLSYLNWIKIMNFPRKKKKMLKLIIKKN